MFVVAVHRNGSTDFYKNFYVYLVGMRISRKVYFMALDDKKIFWIGCLRKFFYIFLTQISFIFFFYFERGRSICWLPFTTVWLPLPENKFAVECDGMARDPQRQRETLKDSKCEKSIIAYFFTFQKYYFRRRVTSVRKAVQPALFFHDHVLTYNYYKCSAIR